MVPADFFKIIFGGADGFVAICLRRKSGWTETFYNYPDQLQEMHELVQKSKFGADIYFCPQLLSEPKRTKANIKTTTCAWSDLDTCHPRELLVRPTIALESSPNRYQAFWVFESEQDPIDAESISRRIAYHHADQGADRSGWDLTQVLRIPDTFNLKYGTGATAPEVKLLEHNPTKYRLSDFSKYPQAEGYESLDLPFPQLIIRPGLEILEERKNLLSGEAFSLFNKELINPEDDRSQLLFRLEMLLLEGGLPLEDVFQIVRDSPVNKWPERPDLLWRDLTRAQGIHQKNLKAGLLPVKREMPLVTDEEIRQAEASPSFIEEYVDWAKQLGDAAVQYHQAGALIALSSMLASSVVLPTSFGMLYTNIWVCILADTTITRKSTAMNLTVDLLNEIDDTLTMSTDGSIEGLSAALAARSGQVSVLVRDEVTGLFEQMIRKEYMGGMSEFFTQLYDGRTQQRHLRKEQIKIKDPRLVMFAGGIKSRMQQLVTYEQVSSGFLPRFIFISAKSDPTKVRPLGPPTENTDNGRAAIREKLFDIRQHYKSQVPITLGDSGKVIGVQDKLTKAELTRDAWGRFNQVDQTMTSQGINSGEMADIITPMYARLGFSILKTAVLLAASRQREDKVIVEESDVVKAAWYGESWRIYAQDIITNVGKGPLEHKITLLSHAIERRGTSGMRRSDLMQAYHITAQDMNALVKTLDERGLITASQHGRAQVLTWNAAIGEEQAAEAKRQAAKK